MEPNKRYKIVLYNGTSSKTISGKLLARVAHTELTRYGHVPSELQTLKHPMLPSGTPFDYKSLAWLIVQTEVGTIVPIYESWIRPNGISEYGNKQIVITGTFKSGLVIDAIKMAFHKENRSDVSLSYVHGTPGESHGALDINSRYVFTLNDKDSTKVWGVYQGTVGYDLLPTYRLNGRDAYAQYSWNEDNVLKLNSWKWLLLLDSQGKPFTIANETIAVSNIDRNQSQYALEYVGLPDDTGQIRSILNILGAESIILGTSSSLD